MYCFGPIADMFIAPILSTVGVCKSIEAYGFRKDENGLPNIEDCQTNPFSLYYVTKESMTLFRALYFNNHGMRDKFEASWDVVGQALASNPYVVGLDPFNEPFPAWTSLLFIWESIIPQGGFDRTLLAPMYSNLYEKFQKSDKNATMWFAGTEITNWLTIRIFGY